MDSDVPALGAAQRLRQHGERHGWGLMAALPRALRAHAHKAMVTEDGPHPTVKVEPTAQHDTGIILGGRATSLPFTAVLSGSQRTTTDNARASSTCTVLSHRRSQSRPISLWEQGSGSQRGVRLSPLGKHHLRHGLPTNSVP